MVATETYGPMDGYPWADQTQWYRFAPAWSLSGVIDDAAAAYNLGSFGLTVSGLSLSLAVGRAWVRGAGYELAGGPKGFTTAANTNASLYRRDRILVRRDLVAKTVQAILVPGTPAASPAAPALQQAETGQWDEPLFSFLVPPASGTVISGLIDERRWINPEGGRSYYDEGAGTSTPVTTTPAAPTNGATMDLPAGTYDFDIRVAYSLSVSAAGRQISACLYTGSTELFRSSFDVEVAGVTASRDHASFTRQTLASASTVHIRTVADATGGTQAATANAIRARRV